MNRRKSNILIENRKIVFLVNPISGTKSKELLIKTIEQQTQAAGIPFQVEFTNAEGNYTSLAKKIIAEKITDVVICGGDGSVSQVTAALMDLDIRFGIIPMGSGNGLALAAGIPRNINKALNIIYQEKDDWVDGFFINGNFSCMLGGVGFDAQVAHDFGKVKKRGLKTYIKLCAINFLCAKPYSFILEAKGKRIESAAYFISIANSNQFGNNFTIAPQASLKDGLLDIVVVKGMNKFVLPLSIMGQLTGINPLQQLSELIDTRQILYFQTDQLVIHNPQHAPLHLDGEPLETPDQLEISVHPKAFRLIHPG